VYKRQEYGPLGVLEYALSARALEEQGAAEAAAHGWASDLALHYQYAMTPDQKGFFPAGDWGTKDVLAPPSQEPLLAAMAGPGSDEAAGWAAWLHQKVVTTTDDCLVYEALAEARDAKAAAFGDAKRATYYVTAGTRKIYARSSWDPGAYWAVFMSSPKFGVDHQHLDASNFVFSRGADPILADPSPYGSLSTLTGNAITVDSQTVQNDYRPSQSPYSRAELPWARATESGVAGARADLAGAFADDQGTSDVPFARRDWVFLPEGEVVAIDRVRTGDPARQTYVRFRSPGAFTLDASGVATAEVGGSELVVHPVKLSSGAPAVRTLKGDANSPCDGKPFGVCDAARFDAGEYAVKIAGPLALAVHVLDGLSAGEAAAEAVEIGDPAVVGARVTRGSSRTFVLASSAQDGAAGDSFAYHAAGDRDARHAVFDAPEDASGRSIVTAKADGDACAISIVAGTGAGSDKDGSLAGRPLVFDVSAAAGGCAVTEEKNAAPSDADGGLGGPGGEPNGATTTRSNSGGCGCRVPAADDPARAVFTALAMVALGAFVRCRPRRPKAGRAVRRRKR
jgi:MYXO-CTERM domain-containing protein